MINSEEYNPFIEEAEEEYEAKYVKTRSAIEYASPEIEFCRAEYKPKLRDDSEACKSS